MIPDETPERSTGRGNLWAASVLYGLSAVQFVAGIVLAAYAGATC